MSETQALKKPFLIGLLAVGAVMLAAVGAMVVVANSTDDRPEGIAERWLTAVGDLTRKGVHDDAVKRVNGHGDASLGEQLVQGVHADGKTAFTALEVGKARTSGDLALVPAQLVARGDEAAKRNYLVALRHVDDSWRVVELREPDPTLKVPSDGGVVAAKAPITVYLVALVIGAGIAMTASALVRAAGREHEATLSTA